MAGHDEGAADAAPQDPLTCERCACAPVCAVVRGFALLITKDYKERPPVDPIQLAKVCSVFVPSSGGPIVIKFEARTPAPTEELPDIMEGI